MRRITALVMSTDGDCLCRCGDLLLRSGCDVHTASRPNQAADLLRKQQYDVIVAEGTMLEECAEEFDRNFADIPRNQPVILIAAEDPLIDGAIDIPCYFRGPWETVFNKIGAAVAQVHPGI